MQFRGRNEDSMGKRKTALKMLSKVQYYNTAATNVQCCFLDIKIKQSSH